MSRWQVLQALRVAEWCVQDAATALGVSRQAVYDAMRRYSIRKQPQPPGVLSEKRRQAANARWGRRQTA